MPGLQLVVEPKIPMTHFLFLLEQSRIIPRLDSQQTELTASRSLWELVALWYMGAVERLLRRGLARDYRSREDFVRVIRGVVDAPRTATAYFAGRLGAICQFEEFDHDTPANRVLRAASLCLVGSPLLQTDLRNRALRALSRMQEVGDLQTDDLNMPLERRTHYYSEALGLAQNVLRGIGRSFEKGFELAWSFLLRTPEAIEAGVHHLSSVGLSDRWTVQKRGMQIRGSRMTLNPDLVLGSKAIGDVKYKINAEWIRSDMYQAVAFAHGFGTTHAAIINFSCEEPAAVSPVWVGATQLRRFFWRAQPGAKPLDSSERLTGEIADWLNGIDVS